MVLEQKTGNPTDGTILEIKQADADPDPFLIAVGGVQKLLVNSSGDIDSEGDLDVAGSITTAGDLTVGGTITMGAGTTGTGGSLMYSFESLTVESGGTAASVTQVVSFITTNGDGDEDAVTLADGTIGQVKIFVSAVEGAGGDSYKVTPAHMNGGTKITFDGTVGDGCTMIFDGTSWNIVSNNGGTIS
jgi:hypothetical protein